MSNDQWIVPGEDIIKSPNYSDGINVKAIIIHYDVAPRNTDSNIERLTKWLTTKSNKSCHFVVLRDGRVIQAVSLDKMAWHAGESAYTFNGKKYTNLNRHSIGIETDNIGLLTRKGDDFYDSYGGLWKGSVMKVGNKYWEPYTVEQIDALDVLISKLQSWFHLDGSRVLGHNEISPGRKIDPGDAFPWGALSCTPGKMSAALYDYMVPFRGVDSHGNKQNPDGIWRV